MKKLLSIILAILMIVTTIPIAFAAEEDTRTIYVKEEITGFNFGYEYWFIDADGNNLDCAYEDLGDNWYKYTVPVSAAKYYMWKGIGGGDSFPYEPIPEKVDALINRNGEAEWYCSHQMNTSGEATCTSPAVCEVCGETYSEVDSNAHDWSNKDGICARENCGYKCPHENYTDGVCDNCEYACPHTWDEGYCRKCRTFCKHEVNENGVCTVCDYVLTFSVITGDAVSYYDRFDDALENAEDGSTVKLMKELYIIASYEINKSITFDLNGNNWETGSSDCIDVNAFVTFTDSVGTGQLNLSLNLYSPCIFNGGAYKGIGIAFETEDTLDDYLAECRGLFDRYTGEFKDVSDKKFVMSAKVDVNHHLGAQTCKGYQCEDCGNYFGEADPDAHDWSNTDGICVICGEACSHEWGEGVLTRPERVTSTDWVDGYYTYTCNICGDSYNETVKRADYTQLDKVLDDFVVIFNDSTVLDSVKSELDSIYDDNRDVIFGNRIESEQAEVDAVAKLLTDKLDEITAGIEDGSAVKVDGQEIFNEKIQEINDELAEKYGEEEFKKFAEALPDEVVVGIEKRTTAIYNEMTSLEGSVKDNEEKLAELKAELDAIFDELENCFTGTHNGLKFEITEEAKCGKNAVESAACTLCGETVTREVENSALTHSFTKYEVTEKAECGKAGKKVAYCDNGCGETDEKEIPALEHLFLDYIYNEDATCTEDGTKTAICLNDCGATDTVTAEDTMLDHADADGDSICDDCETEIKDVCSDCGGPAHEETGVPQYICMLVTLIRLVASLIKALYVLA